MQHFGGPIAASIRPPTSNESVFLGYFFARRDFVLRNLYNGEENTYSIVILPYFASKLNFSANFGLAFGLDFRQANAEWHYL